MRKGSIAINARFLYTVFMPKRVKIVKVNDPIEKTEWVLAVTAEDCKEFMDSYVKGTEQTYEITDWIAAPFTVEAMDKDPLESRMISMRFTS